MALAEDSGARCVEMAWEQLLPSDILTEGAFHNAITVLMAIGGSTNAVVHLLALSRRTGTTLSLDDFERISRRTPLLVDVLPVGTRQMEDFYYAGGLPAVLSELCDLLDEGALTVGGKPLVDSAAQAVVHDRAVIRPLSEPLEPEGGIAILSGNLCPGGAVVKHAAGAPHLRQHTGRAIVFRNKDDLEARIHSPELDVDATSILVLQNAGPVGGPGMPEWGMLPIPEKLAKEGVRDMVRISDARMSGMAYGTCILHVAPEAAVGGPIGLVQDGDEITLDIDARTITLEVSEDELDKRRRSVAPLEMPTRGYEWLYVNHVLQADEGVDFDFLGGRSSAHAPIYRPAETGRSRL
jgi:dihydroxy-acid dehydratase